jgi:hypothetical protein
MSDGNHTGVLISGCQPLDIFCFFFCEVFLILLRDFKIPPEPGKDNSQ